MSGLIKTDIKYRNWIKDVSKRFRQSQLKAAVKVKCSGFTGGWAEILRL